MLDYHAALLADEVRTRAFLEALDRVVRPGMRVLDVGAGTGILALHAARLGAEIVAIERTDLIDLARAIAGANAIEVRFIRAEIRDLPTDALEPVDVVVSEMIGNMLLDEEFLSIMGSARRFLKPGGVMIPRQVAFRAALARARLVDEAFEFWRRDHYGFDFSPIADCAANDFHRDRPNAPPELLGPAVTLPPIIAGADAVERYGDEVMLTADRPGTANAVLLWWEARLDEEIRLRPDPTTPWPGRHWSRTLLPIEPVVVDDKSSHLFRLDYDGRVSPRLWSWRLDQRTRSTFFAIPASRERLARIGKMDP